MRNQSSLYPARGAVKHGTDGRRCLQMPSPAPRAGQQEVYATASAKSEARGSEPDKPEGDGRLHKWRGQVMG